jgi:putative aldouronate transport system permease protein
MESIIQNKKLLKKHSKIPTKKKRALIKKHYQLYLLLLPTMLYFTVFRYIPMYGIQIAFKDYIVTKGIWASSWVGLKHFQRFLNSPEFIMILKNTLGISLYSLVVSFPMPIIIALLLNQLGSKSYKKFVQTVIYAPHFISTVVMVGMILIFLSPRSGVINKIIEFFGGQPIFFMGKREYFKSIFVFSGVWQSTGWGSIIYLAALAGISIDLHEAAVVDGANKWQRILHIDLPGILPTAITMLILNTGSLLSVGFEKVYLMQNSINRTTSEVISTYVYKQGLLSAQFSYSTAVGLFDAIVNLIMLIIVNKLARKFSETSLW